MEVSIFTLNKNVMEIDHLFEKSSFEKVFKGQTFLDALFISVSLLFILLKVEIKKFGWLSLATSLYFFSGHF